MTSHARSQRHKRSHAPPFAEVDWRGASAGLVLMLLITAIGPLTLLLTWLIRVCCVRSRFDPDDCWNSIRIFAWLLTPLTLLVIVAFFVQPALALHLWYHSPLHLFGAPDLLANLWLRWFGSLPLAFALTFVLEQGDRRTLRWFRRVKTAHELAQEAAERRRTEEQAALRQAEEQIRLERARAEERVKAQRAEARKAAARRRAAAALTTDIAPAPEQHKTAQLEAAAPTLWESMTSPPAPAPDTPPPPKKQKPDLGDGSMDALL